MIKEGTRKISYTYNVCDYCEKPLERQADNVSVFGLENVFKDRVTFEENGAFFELHEQCVQDIVLPTLKKAK